jgi:Bacterial Ig-like domain
MSPKRYKVIFCCTICTALLATIIVVSGGCKGNTGLTGPTGASGADALTDPTVKPKILWTFPSNGQIGPIAELYNVNNAVSIRFNKILDVSTVISSIQISPSAGYNHLDTTEISVPSGDVITIHLRADSSVVWAIGQTYTFTVLTTLKDINGNSLSAPYSFSFTPEPYFRVTSSIPQNGDTAVPTNAAIEIVFNNNVNFSTFQSSISILPTISGYWSAFPPNWISFYRSQQLNPNTVYVVTLGTGVKDVQGRTLSSPYTFVFTTGQ